MPNKNKVVLVGVEDNSILLKAIFKPRGKAHQKVEQGAFAIAQYLNMEGLIPPTVAHQFEETEGIISYYIDVEEGQNPWKTKFGVTKIKECVSHQSLNNFYAYARVFGMWDLKWVNTLLAGTDTPYHIMSLDNESLISTVHAPPGEHFFVCWKPDPTCKSSPYADLTTFKPSVLKIEDIENSFADLERFFIHDKSILELRSEERRAAIIKRIKSFMWNKSALPHYIGSKGWWLQLYDGFPEIPPPHNTSLDVLTLTRFRELTLSKLKEFFQDSNPDAPLFPNDHYELILQRGRELLEHMPKE